MKFLLPFCLVCLAFMLSISNIQAQRQASTITMQITPAGDYCFDVIATTPFTSDEISIYRFDHNNSHTSSPLVPGFISEENTDTCQGQICFDESSYSSSPGQTFLNSHVIHCQAKKGEVVLEDGCVIVIGPG